jgi:mRNA interferase RelE/StbE
MAFEVNFSERAAKEFKKLDKQVQKRIIEKPTEYAATENLSEAKKLVNSALGQWRYRIGDYRIIFDLSGKEIQVLKVAHRSEIYE